MVLQPLAGSNHWSALGRTQSCQCPTAGQLGWSPNRLCNHDPFKGWPTGRVRLLSYYAMPLQVAACGRLRECHWWATVARSASSSSGATPGSLPATETVTLNQNCIHQ